MSIFYADVVRNAVLDAISTVFGASPKIRIYSGTAPADESVAITDQVLLAEFTLSPSAASAGAKQFVPSPLTTTALATGTASFYRIVKADGSVTYEQGAIGQGSGDISLDNTSIAINQTTNLTSLTKNAPG